MAVGSKQRVVLADGFVAYTLYSWRAKRGCLYVGGATVLDGSKQCDASVVFQRCLQRHVSGAL